MDLDKLLENIYEAGLEPGGWTTVLTKILHEAGATFAALTLADKSWPAISHEVIAEIGYTVENCESYRLDFAKYDIRRKYLQRMPPGSVVVDGRDLSFSDIDTSLIQNEYYRPRGRGYAMYAWLYQAHEQSAHLVLHRERERTGFDPKNIAVFETLAPHLARSLLMQRQLARAQAAANGLAVALDHFPTAVMLVDAHCKLIGCNSSAETLLRQTSLPLRVRTGQLTATRADDAAALQRMVAAVFKSLRTRHASAPKVLQLARMDGSGPITVLALPLLDPARFGNASTASIMLCLSDPRDTRSLNPGLLAQEFKLSPAEAQVAAQISAGLSPGDIARQRGVSQETVRAQIKSLLGKTGTHSQAQLVGTLMRSLASLRSIQ